MIAYNDTQYRKDAEMVKLYRRTARFGPSLLDIVIQAFALLLIVGAIVWIL